MLRISAVSDLHGLTKFTIMPADVLFIAGDIMPLEIQTRIPQSKEWIKNTFIPAMEAMPAEQIILVAGNHDFVFEQVPVDEIKSWFRGTKITYLHNEACNIEAGDHTYTVFGTPYCHIFGNWAFMPEPEFQKKAFAEIPEHCDILVCHDAPYGVSDVILQDIIWRKEGEHIGNPELADAVLAKQPRLLLHGHLHSTNHEKELLGKTEVYNVSIKDEHYCHTYPSFHMKFA